MLIHLFKDYRPHAGQRRLHAGATRFVSVCAGVRSGKTHGVAREFLRRIYADRFWKSGSLHYWAVAPTHDLTGVQQREILEVLGASKGGLVTALRKSERQLELKSDILIEFKSAHRPERLVGVGLDGLWIDEAARIDNEAWKGQLRMRLSDRLGWGLFSTTPLSRNWFYNEIWQRGEAENSLYDPHYSNVHFTTAQNTALPHLKKEVAQARRELPARYFAREYMASFEAFVGQVYEEFDRKIHLATPEQLPKSFDEVRVGVDWGFRNPGAMIVVGLDGDGTWWAVEEFYKQRLPVDSPTAGVSWVSVAKKMAEQWRPAAFLCDPSRPEHIRAFCAAGLPAKAADNHVAAGIQRVATLLHVEAGSSPRLRFLQSLTQLLSEIVNYRWREDDPAAEEPVKENDHALDALRYALSAKPHKPGFW